MFCEKCGAQMEEDSLFCPVCGSRVESREESSEKRIASGSGESAAVSEEKEVSEKDEETGKERNTEVKDEKDTEGRSEAVAETVIYCPDCGAKNEADAAFCISCGASLTEELSGRAGTGKKISGKIEGAEKGISGKKNKKLFAGIVAAAVILAGVIVCALKFGGGSGQMPLVYLKDNEIVSFNGKEKAAFGDDVYKEDSYRLNEVITYLTRVSEDGKYIFYPVDYDNGVYDLYCRNVKDKDAEGKKLVSSIETYTLLKNGKVLCLGEGKLYISDLENREKIASDVWGYEVSADGSSVLWMTSDEDDRLYVCGTDSVEDKKKLDSDVWKILYYSDNFETILYRKKEGLYYLKNLEEKEKITSESASDYCLVASGKETVFYYLVKNGERFTFLDLIKDDTLERAWETEFLRGYFYDDVPWQEWDTSTLYSYNLENGEKTECQSGFFPFGISLNNIDSYSYTLGDIEGAPAFSYLCCDVEEAESIKLSTIAKWDEEGTASTARVCGEIWKNLSATAELHLVSGSTDIVLDYNGEELGWAAGVGSVEGRDEYYIYTMSMDSMLQMIRDENGYTLPQPEVYLPGDSEEERILRYGNRAYQLGKYAAAESFAEEAIAAEEAAEAVYAEGETGYYDYAEAYDNFLRKSERADENARKEVSYAIYKTDLKKMDGKLEPVAENTGNFGMLTDKGIYYAEDVEESIMEGELFFDGNRVDSDVLLFSVEKLPGKEGIFYLADYDAKNREGTLKIYADGESKKIADDVALFFWRFNEKSEAVFLVDYNFEKERGDLKKYSNKEITSIDDDVTAVLNFE